MSPRPPSPFNSAALLGAAVLHGLTCMAWHDLTCRLTAWLTLYCCIAFAPNSGGELFEQKKRKL